MHGRQGAALLMVLVGLGATASTGCLDADPLAGIRAHVNDPAVAFTAYGTHGDANVTVTLSGLAEVPNADRTTVSAYLLERLTATSHGQWYLDADLRVIAVRRVCTAAMYACHNVTKWLWDEQGGLAPYGLGYPALIAKGALRSWEDRLVQDVPWASHVEDDGRLRLTVHQRRWDRNVSFWYTEGSPIADTADETFHTVHLGEPLSGAHRLAQPAPMAPRMWKGEMFPDEDQDHFGVGATHRQIIEAAKAAVDEAACVDMYRFIPLARADDDPPPLTLTWTRETADALVWMVHDGRRDVAFVRVQVSGGVGQETMTSFAVKLGEVSSRTTSLDCEEVRRAPWPDATLASALDTVNEMRISAPVKAVWFEALWYFGAPEAQRQTWRIDLHSSYGDLGHDEFGVQLEPYGVLPLLRVNSHPDSVFWN